jgi:hypothetical protein
MCFLITKPRSFDTSTGSAQRMLSTPFRNEIPKSERLYNKHQNNAEYSVSVATSFRGCVKSIKTVFLVILNEVKNPVFMGLSGFFSRSAPSE